MSGLESTQRDFRTQASDIRRRGMGLSTGPYRCRTCRDTGLIHYVLDPRDQTYIELRYFHPGRPYQFRGGSVVCSCSAGAPLRGATVGSDDKYRRPLTIEDLETRYGFERAPHDEAFDAISKGKIAALQSAWERGFKTQEE